MKRRSFLTYLSAVIVDLTATAHPQKSAVMEKGKAVTCESGDPIKCPIGHTTCVRIDAPLVIGNDSYQNPDVAQLRDYHVLRCDICHMLFTRE